VSYRINPSVTGTHVELPRQSLITWSVLSTQALNVTVTGTNFDASGLTGAQQVCPGSKVNGFCNSSPGNYDYTITVRNTEGQIVFTETQRLTVA
jgi:hypothetical protein